MAFKINFEMGLTGPSQSDIQSIKSGLDKSLGKQSILIKPEIDKASIAAFKRELSTQLGAITVPVSVKVVGSSLSGGTVSQSITKQIGSAQALKDLERNLAGIEREFQKIERSRAAHSIHTTAESLDQFADRAGIALKRFLAFSVATTGVIKLAGEMRQAFSDAVKFEESLVKIGQVSDRNLRQLDGLRGSILGVSRSIGTASNDIADAALTIAQAGLPLNQVKDAMEAIAKADVSPTFGSSQESAEALIATMSQFKEEAGKYESVLSRINFISAKEAVESKDLIDAIQRGGGAAALAGTKFNEYLSIITAVRATTRESADQIATGIRTITANIASPKTIEFFRKKYKVDIAPGDKVDDLVTAIEKIKNRLGELGEIPKIVEVVDPETGKVMEQMTTKTVAFSEALEILGGKRNQSRLIPLFTQLDKIKNLTSSFDEVDPLTGLKKSESTLVNDVEKAQAALQRSIDRTKASFMQLGDEILKNENTRGLIELFLGISRAIADTTKEIVKLSSVLGPILAPLGTAGALTFAKAFSPSKLFTFGQKRAHGGEIFGNTPGDSVPCMLTPGEVVLNRGQQQNLGRVTGEDPKRVFGKIGVPGFAGGGEIKPWQYARPTQFIRDKDLIVKDVPYYSGLDRRGNKNYIRNWSDSAGRIRQRMAARTEHIVYEAEEDSRKSVSYIGERGYADYRRNVIKDTFKQKLGLKSREGSDFSDIAQYIPPESKFLGSGIQAVAFKTPDGRVVRVQKGGVNRSSSPFVVQPIFTKKNSKFSLEILPYASMVGRKFNDEYASDMVYNSLKASTKYKINDLHHYNAGFIGGKPVVVDPEAIVDIKKFATGGSVGQRCPGLFAKGGEISWFASGGLVGYAKGGKIDQSYVYSELQRLGKIYGVDPRNIISGVVEDPGIVKERSKGRAKAAFETGSRTLYYVPGKTTKSSIEEEFIHAIDASRELASSVKGSLFHDLASENLSSFTKGSGKNRKSTKTKDERIVLAESFADAVKKMTPAQKKAIGKGFDPRGGYVGIFGAGVAEDARKYAERGRLYAYDANEYYHKVNPDGSLDWKVISPSRIPKSAKIISSQPYHQDVESGVIAGANIIPLQDPKITKLDELKTSGVARSSHLDPILKRMDKKGILTGSNLLASINKRGPNQIVKTAFGDNNVQSLGVFGLKGLTEDDANEIIRQYKSGEASGFFTQSKVKRNRLDELRVHIAVGPDGEVSVIKGGTISKETGFGPSGKTTVENLVNKGLKKDFAENVSVLYSRAAKVAAKRTIEDLVKQKGIKNAFFGVDVGATGLRDAIKAGVTPSEFKFHESAKSAIVYETNPSEFTGSSGYVSGSVLENFVKGVFGEQQQVKGKFPKRRKSKEFDPSGILDTANAFNLSGFQEGVESEKNAIEASHARIRDYISSKTETTGPSKSRRLFSGFKDKVLEALTANPFDENGLTKFQADLNKKLKYVDVRGNDIGGSGGQSIDELRRKVGNYNSMRRFAHGGTVPGSGHGDTVPALLSPGEVVLNKRQQGKLDQLTGSSAALFKAAGVPGFNTGGVIGKVATGLAVGSSLLPNVEGFGSLKGAIEFLAPSVGTLAASFIGLRAAFENVKGIGDWRDQLNSSNDSLMVAAKNLDALKETVALSADNFKKANSSYNSKNFGSVIAKKESEVKRLESVGAPQEQIDRAKATVTILQNKENELRNVRNNAAKVFNIASIDPRIKQNKEIIAQENEKIALNAKQIAQAEKNAKILAGISAVALATTVLLSNSGTKNIAESKNFDKESESLGKGKIAAAQGIGGVVSGAGVGFQFGGPKGAAIGGVLGGVAGTISGIVEADKLIKEKYAEALRNLTESLKGGKQANVEQIGEFEKTVNRKYSLTSGRKDIGGGIAVQFLPSFLDPENPSNAGINDATPSRDFIHTNRDGGILNPSFMTDRKSQLNVDQYAKDQEYYLRSSSSGRTSIRNITSAAYGVAGDIALNPAEEIAKDTSVGSQGGKYFKNIDLSKDIRVFLDEESKKYKKYEDFSKQYQRLLNLESDASNIEREYLDRYYRHKIDGAESVQNRAQAAQKSFDQMAVEVEKFQNSLLDNIERIQRGSGIGVLLGEQIRAIAPSLRKPDISNPESMRTFKQDVGAATGGFGEFGKRAGQRFIDLTTEQEAFQNLLAGAQKTGQVNLKDKEGKSTELRDVMEEFFTNSKLPENLKAQIRGQAEDKITNNKEFNLDTANVVKAASEVYAESIRGQRDTIEAAGKATIEATNRLLEFSYKVNELNGQITDLRKPFDAINSAIEIRGASRELTPGQVLLAQRTNETARTSVETGGLDAAGLRNRILGGDQRLQGLQRKLDVAQTKDERASLIAQIAAEEAARTKASKGLEFLANSTQELSVVQQQLQKAESDRLNKRSLFETLAFGSSEERFGARRNINRLNSGMELGRDSTREVVNFLRQFGDTALKDLGINRAGTASQEAERISADFIRKNQGSFNLAVGGRDLGQEILQGAEQKKLGKEAEGLVQRQQNAKNEQANVLEARTQEIAKQAFKEFTDVFKNFKAENLVVNAEKVVLNGAADIKGAISLEGNMQIAVNINAPGFEQMGEELRKNIVGQVNAQVVKILQNNGIPVDRPVV